MTLRPWQTLGEERLLQFKVFDVRKALRRSPRTGRDGEFFVLHTLDWVNVVALTDADEVVLVRQFRHGTGEFTLEVPGGVIDAGEDPADTARRELREETGYAAAEVRHLGTVRPNPAIQSNLCHTYLATGCTRVGGLQQDDGEDIEVVTLPFVEVERRVATGEIDHALAVVALLFHRLDRTGRSPPG